MFSNLEKYILDKVSDDKSGLLSYVLTHFKPIKTKRKQVLFYPTETCRYCYFINKGSIQIFQTDKTGKESTRDIVLEDSFATSVASFINGQPAIEGFRTLEPCDLLIISRDSFLKLKETIPPFAQIYQYNLELYYTQSVERMNSLMALDALERVQWIYKNRPELLIRVSNKVVAAYLGLAPATLSRLKRKLYKTLT